MNAPFASAGPRLAAIGYSAIPILPGYKAPGEFEPETGEWHLFKRWQRYCERAPHPIHEIQRWASWPNAGVGVACGRNLVCIDIDCEGEMRAAVEAVLPGLKVGRVGRKGAAWFFRGDTGSIRSRALKIDKKTVIDLLAAGKQAVLPPSVHPDTNKPYRWLTDGTLGNTPLEELPELPNDIFERIGRALEPFGYEIEGKRERVSTNAPSASLSPSAPTAGSDFDRGLSDYALANLGAWVPALGLPKTKPHGIAFRAVAPWTSSGTGRSNDRREPTLSFHPDGIRDWGDGDETYTPIKVVMRALGLDYGAARRWLAERLAYELPAFITLVQSEAKPVEPSYPDERKSVEEAQAAVRQVVSEFFAEHVPAYWVTKGEIKAAIAMAKADGNPLRLALAQPALEAHVPLSWLLRTETALGKTSITIEAIAKAARTGLRIGYAMPTHKLGAELVEEFAKVGVRARVYHGYERADPDAKGQTMCLDLGAMRDAREAGLSIFDHVCENEKTKARCPFFDRCGMIRQRNATPEVWIVPHSLLFLKKPKFISALDALVIDERFHGNAIPNKAETLGLGKIEDADFIIDRDGPAALDESNDLESYRASLVRGLRAHPVGPLDRGAIGITAEKARAAHKLEWQRLKVPNIIPGMDPAKRARVVAEVGPHNKEVFALAGLSGEIADFLEGGAPKSGRVRLFYDEKTGARLVEWCSLKTVNKLWQAPTLILDATAPDPAILTAALGHPVELKASIAAYWSPYGHARQIIRGPDSAGKQGIRDGQKENEGRRNRADLLRHIKKQAALAFPRIVAVVGQKELIKRLKAEGLPPNVETGNFGALAGLNQWERAAGLICIGRMLPPSVGMEWAAGVITGEPALVAKDENGKARYERVTGGIRLADGSAVAVETYRHPDPVAEALRWQSCEGELIQAVGRLRALWRDAANPYFLDIICDVPLPLVVDQVETWEVVKPGHWADMAPGGVILSSRSDIVAAYPELGLTEKQARLMAESFPALSPIDNILIGERAGNTWITYKAAGRRGKKAVSALVLPNGPQGEEAIKQWLEERLGPIELRIEDEAGGEVQADTKAAA